MSVCALFGNRDVYENIDSRPETVLIELIENKKVKRFYVGNNGAFDRMAIAKLEFLQKNIFCFSTTDCCDFSKFTIYRGDR